MHYAVVLHLAVSFCACADILNVQTGHLAERWRRARKETERETESCVRSSRLSQN